MEDEDLWQESNRIHIVHNQQEKQFLFSSVFDENATQNDVFDGVITPLLKDCLHRGKRQTYQRKRWGCLYLRSDRSGQDIYSDWQQQRWLVSYHYVQADRAKSAHKRDGS